MSGKKTSDSKSSKKGEKKTVVYDSLVEGALTGLTGDALYAHVQGLRPDAGNKAIVKAALRALNDPKLTQKVALDSIYELAMQRRLNTTPTDDAKNDNSKRAPAEKKRRKKAA